MSDSVVYKNRRSAREFARTYSSEVTEVHFANGESTTVTLAEGRSGIGSCVGCGNAPCMEKDVSELALPRPLNEFPGNPSLDVCPTRAIRWDAVSGAAAVSEGECIGCGLCIARCPYGAISLVDSLVARVETDDPDGLILEESVEGEHPRPERSGKIGSLSNSAAASLPTTINHLEDARMTLFVRNLLHEVGLRAATRRSGDTNMRIDGVGLSEGDRLFVVEIECSSVLESPRALLEDIAVMHSRYGYPMHQIDPVSIILAFPSTRSEYYQVIRDIENVLGIRCRTITIGALVALMWHGLRLESFSGDALTIKEGSTQINLANDFGLETDEPYPGAFTPAK